MANWSRPITIGGQQGWWHDEGWGGLTVHTFDALRAGPEARPRKAHIILPKDYSSNRTYPVIYMNDGQTAMFPGGPGGKSWRVGETLATLQALERTEPVILVALHPVDRGREYTHAPWFPGHPYGGLPDYAREVAGPIRTWVEANYAVDARRERTMVLGSSHGGLAAFYTAMVAPESFGICAALSPSFWVGLGRDGSSMTGSLDGSALMQVARPVLEDPARRPKLWIDWGERGDGGKRGAEAMARLLPSCGYTLGRDLFVVSDPDGAHDELAWGRRFRSVMERFYAAGEA